MGQDSKEKFELVRVVAGVENDGLKAEEVGDRLGKSGGASGVEGGGNEEVEGRGV